MFGSYFSTSDLLIQGCVIHGCSDTHQEKVHVLWSVVDGPLAWEHLLGVNPKEERSSCLVVRLSFLSWQQVG